MDRQLAHTNSPAMSILFSLVFFGSMLSIVVKYF
jgi:hypothetical protein